MKTLFTFPGQGAQRPGMLSDLPRDDTWQQAQQVLGDELSRLDSHEALQHTRAVQLALLIAGVSAARGLMAQGVQPDMVCGLSIGAYPAAVIAGALDFADALRLVARRGDLMEGAYPHGYGLTAINGLPLQQVEPLVDNRYSFIANINSESQIVIAGSEAAMKAVGDAARAQGANCVRRLAISVPSHCALLNESARKLAEHMQQVRLTPPRCAYLSGNSARVLWQPERIADDLAMNMARQVRWHEAMVAAEEREVRLVLEMPPGGVLTGLTRSTQPQGECLALERSSVELVQHLYARG
ncbi:malonate decarboxylase subunit epsilon [Pantoea phytobeneficialis]|uniref:Malonyl CoA-acyl carrier protein transacylase n=1 Tax=Pantoea phytobeneficialis TaxID=2052056 RepID=A0AAP9KRR0_9GAMM|nr:malonate decarboxylase subunit epsilon [Pantoea phytobeneficialis]MDO6406788.1 malonate decarboxylase subunit epsilon [Pantoea phytobeneficialis]QGR09314.1 malonate decarboxylase subunit epsilon [Pantoea phytobeneficialis]